MPTSWWISSIPDWASIRTADIDGDGDDEVLALDGSALQTWSYDPASRSWKQWQPSTPLALAGQDWIATAGFDNFDTIKTGDVDGDGHDDVIARGPTGVRTWFYNRRGTGGWERYLPEGLPAFPGGGTPNTGQAAAYDALNAAATDPINNVIPQTAKTVRGFLSARSPSPGHGTQPAVGPDHARELHRPADPQPAELRIVHAVAGEQRVRRRRLDCGDQHAARGELRRLGGGEPLRDAHDDQPGSVHRPGRRVARHRQRSAVAGSGRLAAAVQHAAAVEHHLRHRRARSPGLPDPRSGPAWRSPPTPSRRFRSSRTRR